MHYNKAMKKYIIAIAALVVMGATGTVLAASNNNAPKKYFVCKYVGTPGINERLQTGNNPISVSENALSNPVVGAYFNDAQGRSYVVAQDTGQPDPTCPTVQNNPCQYDLTLLATDPKCVKPADPVTPVTPTTPQTTADVPSDPVTGEVFYGK